MSVARVGRIYGSVARLTAVTPEDVFGTTELFVTVGLEHRLTADEHEQLSAAGLNASQINELDATLHPGKKTPGQHKTRSSHTKKGKPAGLYCEFYSDLELQLYHGWERTCVIVKVCRHEETGGKRSTRVLGTIETPTVSIQAQAYSGFFDVLPTPGSELYTAKVKVTLTLEESTQPIQPQRGFDVKASGLMGGRRRMTLGQNRITVRKANGALEDKYAYTDLKRIANKGVEILLFVEPDHVQAPVRYVAEDTEAAAGIAALIQSEIHQFAINVAVQGLAKLASERESEEAAKLAETRSQLRTSSADSRHALTHQSSLAAQTKQRSVTGDDTAVRISPIAQLNCNLLLADTSNDVGKALQAFAKEWNSLRQQADVANALQRVRVFCDTGEFPTYLVQCTAVC